MPLEKLLRKGGVVASPEGDKVCIGFKYERLVGLCFGCGRIGHKAKECSFQVDYQQELPYGEWLKAGFRKNFASANTGGGLVRREVDTQVGPSHGRVSLQSVRENVNMETDSVRVVLGQKHVQVDSGVFVGGPSKGGVMIGAVKKAETVALDFGT